MYHRILAGITAVSLWPTISDKSLPRKVFLYKNFSVIYRCFAHHFPQLLSEHKQGDPDSIVAVDKTEMFVEFHRTEKERKEKSNQMQGSSVYKQHFRIILLLQQTLGIIAKERRKQIFEQTNVRSKLAQQKSRPNSTRTFITAYTYLEHIPTKSARTGTYQTQIPCPTSLCPYLLLQLINFAFMKQALHFLGIDSREGG